MVELDTDRDCLIAEYEKLLKSIDQAAEEAEAVARSAYELGRKSSEAAEKLKRFGLAWDKCPTRWLPRQD